MFFAVLLSTVLQGATFEPLARAGLIGDLVVDFYCAGRRLVIEIDGIAHDMGNNPERDQRPGPQRPPQRTFTSLPRIGEQTLNRLGSKQ